MANNTNWLNISQSSGQSGTTQLSLTAMTNTSLGAKTVTVTASNSAYNVSDSTTVTIEGFVPTLTLSRSTLHFDSTGGTATFTVYSNTAWAITFPSLVHSYSTSAGTGNTEVSVVVGQNLDEVGKVDNGIVKDVYNVNQLYLTIVQDSFIAQLTVTPDDDITFVNTGSSTSITIDTNTDWELEYPSWITPSITSGSSGTTTVTFTADENGPTDRSGTITVIAGSKEVTINVYQPFYIPPYITVTPSAWTFNYGQDGKTFIVDSYPSWTAEIIETAETAWDTGIYMTATYVVPSATTIQLWNGNSGGTVGIYNGPVAIKTSAVTVPSSGTYKFRYEIEEGSGTPVNQSNPYLTELYISDDVLSIQSSAFTGCSALSSVTIGDGVERINAAAFCGCTALSSITIGTGMEEIRENAFSGCSSLQEITIAETTAPSICANTFYGVATGGTLNFPEGSDYNSWLSPLSFYLGYYGWPGWTGEDHFTAYYSISATGVTAILRSSTPTISFTKMSVDGGPEVSVTRSYNFTTTGTHKVEFWTTSTSTYYEFGGVLTLTAITLPDFLVTIGEYTFQNCSGLTGITIPKSVTNIENFAFQHCTSLQAMTSTRVPAPTISDYTFMDIGYNGALTIPNGDAWYPGGYSDWFYVGENRLVNYNWYVLYSE